MSKGLDPRHQWHLRTFIPLDGSSSWDVVWAVLGLLLVVCVLGACGGWWSEGGALSHAERGRVSGVCLIGPVALWGSVTVCCGGDPMGLLFCV